MGSSFCWLRGFCLVLRLTESSTTFAMSNVFWVNFANTHRALLLLVLRMYFLSETDIDRVLTCVGVVY